MRIPRVYLPTSLQTGSTVVVSDNRLHYLAHVLRLSAGAEVIVFNGEGGEFEATVTAVSKRQMEIQVGVPRDVQRESPLHITLAQGLAKGEKMDWIVQKATELGVSEVQPLFTRYSDVKLNDERADKRRHHWQEIAISASEQCGRVRVPAVQPPQALDNWIAALPPPTPNELRVILHPGVTTKSPAPPVSTAIILIGPEGGFREDELTQARMAGFIEWNLGPRILRTETASISAISLVQSRWGDLGDKS